jgi:mannose-6-phosphate isomerase-like protein (cupin superfamily)
MMNPVFENDRVRAIEATWDPKASVPRLQQEGADTLGIVGVVLKAGTLEYTDAKGKKTRQERKLGEILWQAASEDMDARQNVGADPMTIMQVRLKKIPPTKEYAGIVGRWRPVLDNPRFAAFDYLLMPGAKLPTHKYASRVWVFLDGGELRMIDKSRVEQGGKFLPNQVTWLPAAEQSFENIGKTPIRLISIELK